MQDKVLDGETTFGFDELSRNAPMGTRRIRGALLMGALPVLFAGACTGYVCVSADDFRGRLQRQVRGVVAFRVLLRLPFENERGANA